MHRLRSSLPSNDQDPVVTVMLDSSTIRITPLASGIGGDQDVDVEVNNGRAGQEWRPGNMELVVGVSASHEKRGRR
jgi:hypothetical protein